MAKSLLRLKHSWNYIAITGEEHGAREIGGNNIIPFSFAKNNLQQLAKDCDFILTIGDLWNYADVFDLVSETGVKWISYFGCEGQSYPREAFISRTQKLRLDKIFEMISQVWTYTEESENVLKSFHPDIKILPHSIDYELIKNSPTYPLKKTLNMPSNKKLAVFVGDNILRKGIDLILKWLAMEEEWICYLHTPPFKTVGFNIPELIKTYNLKSKLWTRTHLEKVLATGDPPSNLIYGIMKSADLYIHPHRAEGFGLTVLEALCCKIPVLATDTAGPKTYLPKGCKIPIDGQRFLQLGGVGYLTEEPNFNEMVRLIRKGKGTHDFQKAGFTNNDFIFNLQKLLSEPIKNKYWMEV
jgi:glycosyltransferase involved in cell wall biosynthesis